MIECEIDFTTPDGAMNTFITMPDEGGPHRLVIFYMDAPGKREELHDMARRIATTGYAVMLPNLYYRDVREFELGRHGDRTRMFELMNGISNDDVVPDTRALLEHADSHADIDARAVGCVGYCMSGPFAIYVAAELPERIRAAASIHGVRLATDRSDSPHRALLRVKGGALPGGGGVRRAHPEAVARHLRGDSRRRQREWTRRVVSCHEPWLRLSQAREGLRQGGGGTPLAATARLVRA